MIQTIAPQPLPASTKDIARDLYLKGEKTQTAIAGELDIHPKTLSYWIKQNNWKELKIRLRLTPVMIRLNLLAQIEELQAHILTRQDAGRFPDKDEVMMQYKLVCALFKFPDYDAQEIKNIYTDITDEPNADSAKKQNHPTPLSDSLRASGHLSGKNIPGKDNPPRIITQDQLLNDNSGIAEGIKKDKESINATPVQSSDSPAIETADIPKKNIVLRSGARWIEKATVYDPAIRRNRKLTRTEYDELIRKGISKREFGNFIP